MKPLGAALSAVLIAATFFIGRCTAEPSVAAETKLPPVVAVATWDGGMLTVDEVRGDLDELGPQGRQRYRDRAALAEFVSGLAREALLADVAERDGLTKQPGFRRRYRANLADAFVTRQKQSLPPSEPTDAEVRQRYEDQHARFSQQASVRAAHILVAAPSDAKARGAKRSEAEKLLTDVVAKAKKDFYAFGSIAQVRSDDARTKVSGGDFGAKSEEELARAIGDEGVQVLRSLSPGEVAPKVVEAADGFHLLRLIERREAQTTPLERVRETILNELRVERRDKAWTEYLDRTSKALDLHVNDEVLKSIAVGGP